MERRPGTPRLLRELNDRAALELLLTHGPMTRAQVGERTGLSKVTASQLLSRLEGRGLVEAVGEQAGGPGPNAALYAVVPSIAYVAGLHVEHDEVSAGVADVTGRVVTEIRVDPNGTGNPVELVRGAVAAACGSAGVELSRLRALVIGTPGVLDPQTGDPRLPGPLAVSAVLPIRASLGYRSSLLSRISSLNCHPSKLINMRPNSCQVISRPSTFSSGIEPCWESSHSIFPRTTR